MASAFPFETQDCSRARLGWGALLLDMTRQVQAHSPACKPPHWELLLPSSKMFLTSSQGVGGGAGFTQEHPGLPRCGSHLLPLPGEGCTSVSVRRLWDRAGFRVWHFLWFLCKGVRKQQGEGSPAGWQQDVKQVEPWACSVLSMAQLAANSMGKLAWAVKTRLIS